MKKKHLLLIFILLLIIPLTANAGVINVSAVMMKLVNFGRDMVASVGTHYKSGIGFFIFTLCSSMAVLDFIMTAGESGTGEAWKKGTETAFFFGIMLVLYGDINFDFYTSQSNTAMGGNTPLYIEQQSVINTGVLPQQIPMEPVIQPHAPMADPNKIKKAAMGSPGLVKVFGNKGVSGAPTLLEQFFNFIKDIVDGLSGAGVSANIDGFSKILTLPGLASSYCNGNESLGAKSTCVLNTDTIVKSGESGFDINIYNKLQMIVDAQDGCYGSGAAATSLAKETIAPSTAAQNDELGKNLKNDSKPMDVTGMGAISDKLRCYGNGAGFIFKNAPEYGIRTIMWSMNVICEIFMSLLLILVAMEMVILSVIGTYIWPFIIWGKTRNEVIAFIRMYLSFAMIPGIMSLLQTIFDAMILYCFSVVLPWMSVILYSSFPVVLFFNITLPAVINWIVVGSALAILVVKLMFVKKSQEIAKNLFDGQFSKLGGFAKDALGAIQASAGLIAGGVGLAGAGAAGALGGAGGVMGKMSGGMGNMGRNFASNLSNAQGSGVGGTLSRGVGSAMNSAIDIGSKIKNAGEKYGNKGAAFMDIGTNHSANIASKLKNGSIFDPNQATSGGQGLSSNQNKFKVPNNQMENVLSRSSNSNGNGGDLGGSGGAGPEAVQNSTGAQRPKDPILAKIFDLKKANVMDALQKREAKTIDSKLTKANLPLTDENRKIMGEKIKLDRSTRTSDRAYEELKAKEEKAFGEFDVSGQNPERFNQVKKEHFEALQAKRNEELDREAAAQESNNKNLKSQTQIEYEALVSSPKPKQTMKERIMAIPGAGFAKDTVETFQRGAEKGVRRHNAREVVVHREGEKTGNENKVLQKQRSISQHNIQRARQEREIAEIKKSARDERIAARNNRLEKEAKERDEKLHLKIDDVKQELKAKNKPKMKIEKPKENKGEGNEF